MRFPHDELAAGILAGAAVVIAFCLWLWRSAGRPPAE